MSTSQIIQIIPAPAGLTQVSADGCSIQRVVCLALVEDGDGQREVEPITTGYLSQRYKIWHFADPQRAEEVATELSEEYARTGEIQWP
jgi:hypothetical protein